LKYTPAPECIIVKGGQDYYFMAKTGNRRFISYIVVSSSVGATARCGLWPVEQYLSIFSYPSPTLSIFSLPALEDLFPLST